MKLADTDSSLNALLTRGGEGVTPQYSPSEIRISSIMVSMRDGTKLATDIYCPPIVSAPVIVTRTPYDRRWDRLVGLLMSLARRGYVAIAQDCRGTGGSEPECWDYYVFESEDGYDFVEWITNQPWYGGFIGSFGGSYVGQTQWPMATHKAMSAIVPHVSGLGIAVNTVHQHMFLNGYALVVGKGEKKLKDVPFTEIERLIEPETMSTGFFNEALYKPLPESLLAKYPQLSEMAPAGARSWLLQRYSSMQCAERATFIKEILGKSAITAVDVEYLSDLFGPHVPHDAHVLPYVSTKELCQRFVAPPLIFTSWYDWCLNDALATWETLRREARHEVASRMSMLIGPQAHNTLGYHEGIERHPELQIMPGALPYLGVLLRWYERIRSDVADSFPRVIYYLMGANEWQVADDWPLSNAGPLNLYLGDSGVLTREAPSDFPKITAFDSYTYDPLDPTPTKGGSIISYLYPPGSVDVSDIQRRADVLVYETPILEEDLDVIGPLRMVLYASSSAVDTDFAARLSDVFPDGRAIQLQNCLLRARYRQGEPKLLEPNQIYQLEIDMWATANRFKAGHRIRLDISSADFSEI